MFVKWDDNYNLISVNGRDPHEILTVATLFRVKGQLAILKEINKEWENLELKDFSFPEKIKNLIETEIRNDLERF